LSICAEGYEGEALVMKGDLKGLAVSSGSACHRGIIEPSCGLEGYRLESR
jgi:cysteine sulfinate desulfinase/cysteine desulfurase-like protein